LLKRPRHGDWLLQGLLILALLAALSGIIGHYHEADRGPAECPACVLASALSCGAPAAAGISLPSPAASPLAPPAQPVQKPRRPAVAFLLPPSQAPPALL
jgi:hypothetical protein